MQQQLADGIGFGQLRARAQVRRNHPLGQVVEPLEAAPPGDRHLAGGEQPLQRMLLGAPVPPGAGAFLAGAQGPGTQGALLVHGGEHALDHVPLLAAEARQLLVDATPLRRPLHAPAHRRVEFQGQQRSLVPQYSNSARRRGPQASSSNSSRG